MGPPSKTHRDGWNDPPSGKTRRIQWREKESSRGERRSAPPFALVSRNQGSTTFGIESVVVVSKDVGLGLFAGHAPVD